MSDLQVAVAILYLGAYLYLAVKCLRDGILPNSTVYPLAVIAVVARPDGIGVLPIDHLPSGLVVLLVSYFLYSRGGINAGLAKVAAVVALASAAQIGLPALGATLLFCVGSGVLLTRLRLARLDESLRYGAFFPLAGVHSVLWIYFPSSTVLVVDALMYGAMLVAMVLGLRRSRPAETVVADIPNRDDIEAPDAHDETTVWDLMSALEASVEKAKRSEAARDDRGRRGDPLITTAVPDALTDSQPTRAAEINEPTIRFEEPAPDRRIGELIPIPAGSLLLDSPDTVGSAGVPADRGGPAVVLAKRRAWLQVRDIAGNVGWLAPNRHIRIVIVDDVDEIRENLGKLIGFETDMRVVGLASDGEEGLRAVQSLTPDIVLMDINMPVMDGITATEILSHTSPSSRVIMMSLQGSQDYLRRAMLAGAKEYLIEPFSADELIEAIRRVASG